LFAVAALAAITVLSPGAAYGDLTKAVITVPPTATACQPVSLSALDSSIDETVLSQNNNLQTIAWDTGSAAGSPPVFGSPIPVPANVQFGTGQVPPAYGPQTVTFSTPGTYTVGVQLLDTFGTVSTGSTTITVGGGGSASASVPLPVPLFSTSTTVAYVGQPITFDGSASYEGKLTSSGCSATATPSVSDQVGGYTWDFGDGSAPVEGSALMSHAFSSPGTYNVILQVASTDPAGGIASAQHAVTVIAPPAPPPPPPPPAPEAATVALPSGTFKADSTGRISVRVRCVVASGACTGKLELTAPKPAHPEPTRAASRGRAQTIVLASASFSIAAGKSTVVRLTLTRGGRSDVQSVGGKGLTATLSAVPSGAHAALAPVSRTVRLITTVPPPRKRRTGKGHR
jgi:PKD domain